MNLFFDEQLTGASRRPGRYVARGTGGKMAVNTVTDDTQAPDGTQSVRQLCGVWRPYG